MFRSMFGKFAVSAEKIGVRYASSNMLPSALRSRRPRSHKYALALVPTLIVTSLLLRSSDCDNGADIKRVESDAVKLADNHADDLKLVAARPSPSEWIRVDDKLKDENEKLRELIKDNAIHDTLMGDRMIQAYEIYKSTDPENKEVLSIFHFGDALNGHPGVVHGGILALAFDNSFGWVSIAGSSPPGVTANLNINYRKPVMAGSVITLRAKPDSVSGRKKFLSAYMENEHGVKMADATSLFISLVPRKVVKEDVKAQPEA